MRPRNRLISLAALACALTAALFLWRTGAGALGRERPAPPEARAAEPPSVRAALQPSESGAPREAAPRPVEESGGAATARPAAIRGQVAFLDGVPADRFPLRLGFAGDRGNRRALQTDNHGSFELAEVEPGRTYFLFGDATGARDRLGELAVGDEGRTWVLPVVRLRMQTVDDAGASIPSARLSVLIGESPEDLALARRMLPSDGEGLADAFLEPTGFAEIHAVMVEQGLQGRKDALPVVPGLSRETQRVILRSMDAGASLEVQVICRSCGRSSPFLCRLLDDTVGLELRVLHAEDVGADGLIHGLPEGAFRLELDRRYRSPLGSYALGKKGEKFSRPVTLAGGTTARERFDVDCGARLRLRVLDPSSQVTSELTFRATLVPEGAAPSPAGDEPRPVDFLWQHPDRPDLWTEGQSAPLGLSCATEPPVPPGLYYVTVQADGFEEWQDTVVLEPCQETAREIVLQPGEQKE